MIQKMTAELANGARMFSGRHLEAGLVRYDDFKHPNGSMGATLLLPKDTIDRMRPTFGGKPVVNLQHKKVSDSWFKEGKADGITVDGFFDGGVAWEVGRFMAWDEDTQRNCEDGFQLSCAYVPTEIDWKPGVWHNLPYDGVIVNGEYTHLAVVPNPRYEGAVIFCNSKGDAPMKILSKLFGDKPVELDKSTKVKIDDKSDVSLEELVNAHLAAEAAKAKVTTEAQNGMMNDDTELEIDGKKVTLGNLKNAYKERLNSEAEAEKKKKEDEAKNAEEAEKKKKDDEAKNAEEKAKKEKEDKELEAKNALEAKAKADKEAADKAAGEKAFKDLENATKQKSPMPASPYMSPAQKEQIGAQRYGSKPTGSSAVKP